MQTFLCMHFSHLDILSLLVNCLSVFFQFSIVVVNHNRFCQIVKKVNPVFIVDFLVFIAVAVKFYGKLVPLIMVKKPVLYFLQFFDTCKFYIYPAVFINLVFTFCYFQFFHAPLLTLSLSQNPCKVSPLTSPGISYSVCTLCRSLCISLPFSFLSLCKIHFSGEQGNDFTGKPCNFPDIM